MLIRQDRFVATTLAFVLAGCARIEAQQCQPYWTTVNASGLPGYPSLLYASDDDGDGPRLFAFSPDPLQTNVPPDAWKWDGVAWKPLGHPPVPEAAEGRDFQSIDDGSSVSLYALIKNYPGSWAHHRRANGAIATDLVYRWTTMGWQLAPFGLWTTNIGVQFSATGDVGRGRRLYAPMGAGGFIGEYQGNGEWQMIGQYTSGDARVIVYHDGNSPALYALGAFGSINEASTGGFAKWDGVRWSNPWPPPISIGSGARCAIVWDDGAGPAIFTNLRPQINGVMRHAIHKWTAEGWSVAFETSGAIWDMQVFDDGRGPALYLSGSFTSLGGVAVRNVARWDGHTIEPLGAGTGGFTRQMLPIVTARGPSLFVTTTTSAGGGTVQRAAIWVGCPNCYADCDLDRRLTPADFTCFMAKVAANDPYANCTVDGQIDAADYVCFISKYAAGCP